MKQIFEAVLDILVRALPTFFLVILLHWYLKKVLFQPMERVLDERRSKTEGAIDASEATLVKVQEKLAAYEQALGDARAEIYREQDQARKRLADQQMQALEAAREKTAAQVAAGKAEIAAEADKATSSLQAEVERLAGQIAEQVLAGRAR